MSRKWFQRFYLDREKDMIVDLYRENDDLFYILKTPNHGTGNLITNLAKLCDLPVSYDAQGLKIVEGKVPCYIDGYNRKIYIFRLGNTKVANIYPDGTVEMKASVPAISKTLMSQTKDYRLDIKKTIVKTFILNECKFRTDLHTHMNANLRPDILIAIGIVHQIRYPLYYIKKLKLRCTDAQHEKLQAQRDRVAAQFADSQLGGKYLTRKIDDNTFINFADLILNNPEDALYNIARIRTSLAVMKDGQAVFTNLEKVYIYRYVFAKGVESAEKIDLGSSEMGVELRADHDENSLIRRIPDKDILQYVFQMLADRQNPAYADNSIFQDKLLWIARSSRAAGVQYLEISDTTLVKNPQAADMLAEVHAVMPAIYEETGVVIRFLAAIRRIALTIIKDNVTAGDYFRENLQVLDAVAEDPYVAGADIIGEEINDIRELKPVIREIVRIAGRDPSFVVRIHAGENDSLRDNVANSIACVKDALEEGQEMPYIRVGHGLYTANLHSKKGKDLIRELNDCHVVLEFQITSNVRLNNLTSLEQHPLRQYLAGGVRCVQGTDGGALYGTNSIDEQLSLEKMLNLTYEEMLRMRQCEDVILEKSMDGFRRKQARFAEALQEEAAGLEKTDGHAAGQAADGRKAGGHAEAGKSAPDIAAYYRARIDARQIDSSISFIDASKLVSQEVLAGRIEEMPVDGMPVVLMGGSFNNDRRTTTAKEYGTRIIDAVLEHADPEKIFFVVGHRLRGYEQYLVEQNRTRYHRKFQIFSIVPTMITQKEADVLKKSGAAIRVSIEPTPMGLYKSFAYEIFKRRPSVLLAFDGNSSGANMIQEAKNAKYKSRIYVSAHARMLKQKAESLEGYVTVFADEREVLPQILEDLRV
ncbi:MAG: adenosine deaminase [Eubacterium sp.]|nr:adenosine deaminase [Eubacterium sp.]